MASFECGICLGPFADPVTLACGSHSFCLGCARDWLSRPSPPTCPLCVAPVPRELPHVNVVLRDALAALAATRARPALAEIVEADLVFASGGSGHIVGSGAYGIVHRASWCGTPVAVKSLQRAAGDVGDGPARAFTREMAALAQLRHPHIVHVLGVCHHSDGRVSLVQELAAGGDLYARLHGAAAAAGEGGRSAPLSMGDAARVGLDVARGLAYAHARGVAHNDLKSPNIVFDSGGKAIIVDFGLVRRVKAALPHTTQLMLSTTGGMGGLLGTAAWTAPENFDDDEGNAHYGQPAADIYSLGCVLYEMVTGCVPWEGKTMMQIVRAVDVARRRPDIPAGVDARLSALIGRCWAHEPGARPKAAEVVVELGQITGGAGGEGLAAAAAAAAAVAEAAAHEEAAHVQANAAAEAAAAARAEVQRALSMAREAEERAARAEAERDALREREAQRGNAVEGGAGEGGGAAAVAVRGRFEGIKAGELKGHAGAVYALAVLPDGQLASGSYDKSIRVWDVARGVCVAELKGHADEVRALAVLSDGRLASGSDDSCVRVWDVARGVCVAELKGHTSIVWALAVLPDGQLASGSLDNSVRVWDVARSVCVAELKGHTAWVLALAVLPDGRLASGSADDSVRVWDVARGVCVAELKGNADVVLALSVLSDGLLASGCGDDSVRVWDVARGMCVAVLKGHADFVYSLAVLSDGRLASGRGDSCVRVWDVARGVYVSELRGHTDAVYSLAVLPDGRLASGSADRSIVIWR